MPQDNIPKDIRDGSQRVDEALSDDEYELVEVLGDMVEEVLFQGESDDEAEDDLEGILAQYQPSKDDSANSYSYHTGSVFACDIHPEGKMIVSGGEDDRLVVIEHPSGSILLDCKDVYQDSVTMLGFNHDGKYVFGCDMSGQIAVWKISESNFTKVFSDTVGGLGESSWAKWHPKSSVLLIGGESVWLYKIPSGQCKLVHEGRTETECGEFMPDGKRAVLGFDCGLVKVVDLATGATTCKFEPESTQLQNVLSIAIHPDNNMIAVGSMNSKLGIFKTQQPKTVAVLYCNENDIPPNEDGEDYDDYVSSTEAAIFVSVDGMNVLVVGTDRAIHIWDYTRLSLRHKIVVNEGVTRMLWPESSPYLYVGTRLGQVNVYNAISGESQLALEGHTGNILDLKLSNDRKHLITAGDEGSIKVFNINHQRMEIGPNLN